MKSKILLFSLSLMMTFTSFGQEKTLSLKFNHMVNGEQLELNKTVFSIPNGKAVKITRAEFYLTNFSLFTTDTDSMNVVDSYILVNANNKDKIHTVGQFPGSMNFKKIKMYCGIDKNKNHADPSLYPETHPLGLKDPSMHWGWASGYRFMAIEGMVDNSGDGIPETEFQFHSLGDALLFRALLDMTASHHVDSDPMIVNLDYAKLFTKMGMTGNLIQHGSAAMNKTMLTNAALGGFMTPLLLSATENVPFETVAKITQSNRNLTIEFNAESGEKHLNIYNNSGQLMQSKSTDANTLIVELNNVLTGNYFISLDSNNKKVSKQIFIY